MRASQPQRRKPPRSEAERKLEIIYDRLVDLDERLQSQHGLLLRLIKLTKKLEAKVADLSSSR